MAKKLIEPIRGSSFQQIVKSVASYTPPDSIVNQANRSFLYNKSCLDPKALLPESVELAITSPPYNLGKAYSGSESDDELEYKDYLQFSRQWLKNCYKWSIDTGRLCLNIGLDKNKNGKRPVYSDLLAVAMSVGWKYQTTIIWNESNISKRTAWGSWKSASAPHVIAPVEVIVVLYKNNWKRLNQGESDITAEEFKDWTLGIWNFPGESAKRIGHEAPFPRELPKRCIKLFSFKGDTILDPFVGSGTTMIEAVNSERIAIGIEQELKYCQLVNERLKQNCKIEILKQKKHWQYIARDPNLQLL